MFKEDQDWDDEQDADILSKTVFDSLQKVENKTDTKSKVVGKKSLLRTLQTLGSVPEWTSTEHKDSNSEPEDSSSPGKKRKKRRKKRKHDETSEQQPEDEDKSLTERKKNPSMKKKKETKSVQKTKSNDEKTVKKDTEALEKTQSIEKLSRQQWKNKMKNKKRCKNKYRQIEPEGGPNQPQTVDVEKAKTDSLSDTSISQTTNQKKEKELRPLRKNKTEGNSDEFSTAEKKAQQKAEKIKSEKSEKRAFEESTDEPKMKTGEPDAAVTNGVKKLKPDLSQKIKKLQKILRKEEPNPQKSPVENKQPEVEEERKEEMKPSASGSLRSRMEQRLEAARFRYINEVLYSTTSGEAKRMFQQDPQAFWVYHKGYTSQVQRWPANPVDTIISYILKRPSSLVVADFGCGDCKIARSVKNKVHSFDLAASCKLVTVCDMASVPLADSSVDIAVFCLSLMGTNLADFLVEANRVLKMGGVLKIAEVASRFDSVRSFVTALAGLGFKMTSKDTENSHFFSFEFEKTGNAPKAPKKFGLMLKPCVYKKR